jgi:hypothetical protein
MQCASCIVHGGRGVAMVLVLAAMRPTLSAKICDSYVSMSVCETLRVLKRILAHVPVCCAFSCLAV